MISAFAHHSLLILMTQKKAAIRLFRFSGFRFSKSDLLNLTRSSRSALLYAVVL